MTHLDMIALVLACEMALAVSMLRLRVAIARRRASSPLSRRLP
jgi:hypothetical protein